MAVKPGTNRKLKMRWCSICREMHFLIIVPLSSGEQHVLCIQYWCMERIAVHTDMQLASSHRQDRVRGPWGRWVGSYECLELLARHCTGWCGMWFIPPPLCLRSLRDLWGRFWADRPTYYAGLQWNEQKKIWNVTGGNKNRRIRCNRVETVAVRHDHGVCLRGWTETAVNGTGTSDVETAGVCRQEWNETERLLRNQVLNFDPAGTNGMPNVTACLGLQFTGRLCGSRQRRSGGTFRSTFQSQDSRFAGGRTCF